MPSYWGQGGDYVKHGALCEVMSTQRQRNGVISVSHASSLQARPREGEKLPMRFDVELRIELVMNKYRISYSATAVQYFLQIGTLTGTVRQTQLRLCSSYHGSTV